MAKKTLAEQISKLYTPKSDFDIEDHDLGQGTDDVFDHKESQEDEDDDEEEDDQLRKEHYVESAKSKLRQSHTTNLGKKYTGSVVSRDSLYDDEAEVSGEDSDEVESDEEEDEVQDEEVAEESDESANDSDSGASLRDNSSEDESDQEDDDIAIHKRQVLKDLMNKERGHIINRLSQSATNDALKGYAIQQQHKTFEKLVDIRLKFQKSLTNANLLPIDHETLEEFDYSPELLLKTKEGLYSLLDGLLTLRSQLDESTTNHKHPKKRSYETYSKTTESFDSELNKSRSVILTKWSAKVQNSSGSNAINASKFKTINQSFEQQVINNLSDMNRLIKRTKLNRRQITPLGYNPSSISNGTSTKQNQDEEIDEDIPIQEQQSRKTKTEGSEIDQIFDDEDFYRVLLNDLVDKKVQSSDPTSGGVSITLRSAQRANKLKNNVDTKASKGRKLRYHVQDQISNFETSRGGWKWNDDQIDEFFASLLGQKVNMNEEDEEEQDDEIDGETNGDIIPEDNSIKLFG